MEITRTDVASGFLQDVQAHIGPRFNGIVQLLEASVWDKVEKAFKPCWLSPPRCHQRRRWCQCVPTWSILQHWAAPTWTSARSEQRSGGFQRRPTHRQRNPKETLPGGGKFSNRERGTRKLMIIRAHKPKLLLTHKYLLLYSSLCSTLKQRHSIRHWKVQCSLWPWCGNPGKPQVPLMFHMAPEK